ncbi:FAD-dependent oxidoreductase [Maribacter sp. 2210JD10-5]|uniref:FAD-dependent oxidoreductase n=1 Tax=Maribacter sp. 2210JD10-5 TaxID=3386272 RepID=UPI0039BCCDDB
MKQTLKSEEIEKIIESEICIVGAGAAGISLARKLDELGRSVLLLESGGFDYDADTHALNAGENIGQNYFPIQPCRLRFFGGTTGHWTGQCSTLDDIDFEERDWVANSGWPIKKKDLDKYYEEAHEICDLQEYNYSTDHWEKKLDEKFIAFNNKLARTKVFQKSAPTRFGTKFRKDIVESKNVRLITNANLTYINLTEYGNEVESLTLSTLESKKTHTVKAKVFVLACGAFQNVRHLLNSNNVINKGVGNENDLVGRYFMDQPHVDTSDMLLLSHIKMGFYYDHSLNSKAFGMFATSEEIQRKLKLQNYSTRIVTKSEAGSLGYSKNPKSYLDQWQRLDKRVKNVGKLRNIIGDDSVDWIIEKLVINKKEVKIKEDGKIETSHYIFNTRCEQAPNPDSRVDLADTKDALGVPHVRLNWQLSESDKLSILKSNIILGSELGRLGIGRLKIDDWLLKEKIEWSKLLSGGYHHLGVTRMSNNPKEGVVDKNCKVHSVNNLFIGGSSVFTTSGVSNPTLTIVALALRLANHLDGQYLKGKTSNA